MVKYTEGSDLPTVVVVVVVVIVVVVAVVVVMLHMYVYIYIYIYIYKVAAVCFTDRFICLSPIGADKRLSAPRVRGVGLSARGGVRATGRPSRTPNSFSNGAGGRVHQVSSNDGGF